MKQFPIESLLKWFNQYKREMPWRQTKDIYSVWVSEIMLQQTQVVTVIPYYQRFMARFPTVKDLAEASEQEVLKLWEGLGYYSRARNLHKAAKLVMSEYGGSIPDTPEGFRKLSGVGPYIGAAVMSITQDVPLPVVDGNVMRVYARFCGMGSDIRLTTTRNEMFKQLSAIIPHDQPGDFNQALMELGALICTPTNPKCKECPLATQCVTHSMKAYDRFPFKSRAEKAPTYRVSVAIIFRKDQAFYIQKRPSSGHLGGLWEFPGGKAMDNETPEQTLLRECREELNHDIVILEKLPIVHHAYTHFKIELSPFICKFKEDAAYLSLAVEYPHQWITINQLSDYPFPGANHKIFLKLREYLNQWEGYEAWELWEKS